MSFFSSHSSKIEGDPPGLVVLGVLFALALQGIFYFAAASVRIAPREVGQAMPMIPPAFNIKKVEISARALDETDEYRPIPKPIDSVQEIIIPAERPGDDALPEEIRAGPVPAPLQNPFDAARVQTERQNELAKAASDAAAALRREEEAKLREIGERLIEEQTKPVGNPRPLLDITDIGKVPFPRDAFKDLPGGGNLPSGYASLDEALGQIGPLRPGSAPILMPTDLLFEYDRYDLRPQAIQSLQKLGHLIQKNPTGTFHIEGHTDSEGPEEYNQTLSELRAATVARWLIETMGIDPARITTRGYGEKRLLVPGDRSREEQALNRRVEIIIRTR